MNRAIGLIAALVAASALAAPSTDPGPPLASSWNIAVTGKAASSGDLDFRISPGDGSNPIDITVPVITGAGQDSVARSIARALGSQLRGVCDVQAGENGNVTVSDPRGQPNFSLELVDSNIEDVRVAVQSVTPAAPPTVPAQAAPAETPPASRPDNAEPGNAVPPANSPPMSNPTPPNASEAAGAPSSAPPPR
jgi:hypothetical protein